MKILEQFAQLEVNVLSMGLDQIWLVKPLFNVSSLKICLDLWYLLAYFWLCWYVLYFYQGSELMSLLNLPKGPLVGKFVEQQMRWQICNPGNDDKNACLECLRTVQPTLIG